MAKSFLSVHVFIFVGSRPPQHSWPAAASQVISSLWDSAPELASFQTAIQHVFLVVIFFATRLYNRNDSRLDMSDLYSWPSGQSVALSQQEIAHSDPNGVLLLSWLRRAKAF